MYYNFNINGEKTRVWMWNDDFHTSVGVDDCKRNRQFERTIRTDENGKKFFTWNKTKVYLKNYITMSMKELKEKIETGEWIIGDDLTQAILHDGIENVRFIVPLNPVSIAVPELGFALCDGMKYVDVLCKVVEKRHKVKDNYKIDIVPVDENAMVGSHDFYTCDFVSMIKSGHIKIVVNDCPECNNFNDDELRMCPIRGYKICEDCISNCDECYLNKKECTAD